MKRSNIGASPNDNYKKQRFSNYSKQSVVSQPPQAYGSHQQNYNKPSQPYGGNYGLGNAAPNLASAASSSSDIYNPYAPGPTYGNTGYAAPSYFQPGNAYSNNSYMNTLASGAYGTATFNGYGAVGMNSLGGGMNNVGPAMGGLAAGSFGSASNSSLPGNLGLMSVNSNPHMPSLAQSNPYGAINAGYAQQSMGGYNPNSFAGYANLGGAGMAAPSVPNNRTIYIGNLPPAVHLSEVLSLIKGGPIDNAKYLEDKNCAFITFLDPHSAAAAYNHLSSKGKLKVRDQEVKLGWGKASNLPANIAAAVSQGASRNVYVGPLSEDITETTLANDLGAYGPIDTVKIVKTKEKLVGFVHFLNISNAIKCVQSLPSDPRYSGKRVNYGKDRCTFQTSGGKAPVMARQGAFRRFEDQGDVTPVDPALQTTNALSVLPPGTHQNVNPSNNRILYLGSLSPEITITDLCNVIRGGTLERIHILTEKSCAFINFVDPLSATIFFHLCSTHGIVVKGKRLKIGWGKAPGPLSPNLLQAVQGGASRNVYVGSLAPNVTVDDLKSVFAKYGEIEWANLLPEKQCGFVNFTDIRHAIKAVDEWKTMSAEEKNRLNSLNMSTWRVSYGKDRCGNFPKLPRNGPVGGNLDKSANGVSQTVKSDDNVEGDDSIRKQGDEDIPVTEDDIAIDTDFMENSNAADGGEVQEMADIPLELNSSADTSAKDFTVEGGADVYDTAELDALDDFLKEEGVETSAANAGAAATGEDDGKFSEFEELDE